MIKHLGRRYTETDFDLFIHWSDPTDNKVTNVDKADVRAGSGLQCLLSTLSPLELLQISTFSLSMRGFWPTEADS